jgi:SNF2 family DNA or RNA helicase
MRFVEVMHGYQKRAVKFLLDNPFSGLFLDPGLGKTASYLMYTKLAKKYLGVKKTLIIAPKRVCYITWPGEFDKWPDFQDLSYTILHGKDKAKRLQEDHDIYLINPEGIKWLVSQLKDERHHDFDVLNIDESTKFKNWTAKRTKMLKKLLRYFKRRHIMTGSPAPKWLIDLFPQVFMIDRGEALGTSITRFRDAYFTHDPYSYSYDLNPGMDKIIHRKVAPLVLQMSAEDYLDLPELIYNKLYIDLEGKAEEVYNDLETKLFAEIEDDEVSLINAAASYNACKQITGGALYHQEEYFPTGLKSVKKGEREYYDIHTQKIDTLRDLVDDLQGKPLMVAYAFNHELIRLQQEFKNVPYIGKGVDDQAGVKIAKDWNAGEIPILLVHPASMSHGLNMQESGRDICWFSMTDNFEEYEQLNRRIYRQGVDSNVTIHHIMARNTVDDMIYIRNIQKDRTQTHLKVAIKNYREQKLKN